MLVRIAACAAWFLAWSACSGIASGVASPPATAAVAQTTASLNQNIEGDKHAVLQAGPFEAGPFEAGPFGLAAEPVSDGTAFRNWSGVQSEIANDVQILARCRQTLAGCPQAARDFLAIIDDGRAQSGRARIGIINRAINLAIVPTTDIAQWGVVDRWSAPLETFTTRRGDCEDYAIAKYVALRAAGVPSQDIRLVVLRNRGASENHAVAAARIDGAWVILDNRWLALVSDRDAWSATPLFVIDENGVRQFPAPTLDARLREGASVSAPVAARR